MLVLAVGVCCGLVGLWFTVLLFIIMGYYMSYMLCVALYWLLVSLGGVRLLCVLY